VPRRGGWFTRMGAATLVVYLCHGFAIKGLEYAGYGGWADAHPVPAFVLTTAGAVGLALLLASRPVAGVLEHVVDPFGYAERHVRRAVRLADAPRHAERIADRVEEAVEEAAATSAR
jgi:hypothetical protein